MAFRAATITVKWDGDRAVAAISQATMRGLQRTARDYVEELLHLILDTPKTGIIYGFHQASAPGEAPASETGRLITSFRIVREDVEGRPVVRVLTNATHARLLEYGTRRMAARPFMRPALTTIRQNMLQNISGEVKKVIGPRIPAGAPRG